MSKLPSLYFEYFFCIGLGFILTLRSIIDLDLGLFIISFPCFCLWIYLLILHENGRIGNI